MPRPGARPRSSIRASDADREEAAATLRQHFADGRLTSDELSERLDRAYGARMQGELDGLFLDMPGQAQPRPSTPFPVPPPRAHRPTVLGRSYPVFWVVLALVVVVMATASAHWAALWVVWAFLWFAVARRRRSCRPCRGPASINR
ncbi:MAG: DUF1707 SHOCT-like domain-containing protein [Acidimicrobiales bacterium]